MDNRINNIDNDELPTGFPILIAYPRPIRFVKQNEKDSWSVSLDELRRREYDYVKLHRLSGSFDVDLPSPFCMHIGFNGAFILPALKELYPLEKSVELFNKFIGKLMLGGVFYNAITPYEIDKGLLYETGYFRGFGMSHDPFARIQATLQTKMAGALEKVDLLHPVFIKYSELHNAYKMGKKVIESIENLSEDLLLKGVSAFIGHSWAEGLSNLWICLEQIVSKFWDIEYLSKVDDIKPTITGRKKFLEDDRTWTTAAKIEMLFNKQLINAEIYTLLNRARKARNDLSHKGYIPRITEVEAAFDAIFALISLIAYGSTTQMDSISRKYKKLDPIEKRERNERKMPKTPIPVEQMKGVWIGPMPPIPGEKQWGNKKYEKVY